MMVMKVVEAATSCKPLINWVDQEISVVQKEVAPLLPSRSLLHSPYTVRCKKESIISLAYELFMIGKRLLF